MFDRRWCLGVLTAGLLVAACGSSSEFNLEKVSGDGQTGVVAQPLPELITVKATGASGEPLVGVQLNFTVVSGGGTVFPPRISTDPNGMGQSTAALGPDVGMNNNTFEVALEDHADVTVRFLASATAN